MPRQLVLPLDYGMLMIKETAPMRLLDAVLKELDYKELQHLYSSKEIRIFERSKHHGK